jgi:hypothetical protein
MKPSDFFDAFNKFFLDIIGTIVPGLIAIIGCNIVLSTSVTLYAGISTPPKDSASWIVWIFASYLTGYLVSSIGERILMPIVEFIMKIIKYKHIQSKNEIEETIRSKMTYTIARERMAESYKFSSVRDIEDGKDEGENFRFWRNLAMGIIQKDNSLVYRFTVISLLNMGVATSLIIVDTIWLVFWIAKYIKITDLNVVDLNILFVLLMFAATFFLERHCQFYRRAMETPFGVAIVELHKEVNELRKN